MSRINSSLVKIVRPYDIIVSVDGRDIWTNEELIRDISGRQPGTVAHLDFLREGHRQTASVKLTERPPRETGFDETNSGLTDRQRAPRSLPSDPPLGLTVRDLDAAITKRLGLEIPPSIQGVIVMRVDPASAPFVPTIRRLFVIMEINRQPVRSTADFGRILAAARTGDALAFYGYDPSVGQRGFVLATMDAR